jgi:SAM-dependent methyltransferase
MGHDDRERRRLALQASIIDPFTEQLFRRAGIAPGMRVLDIGCGVGDVALIAARLVGRHGHVTAIDIDQPALTIARERARDQGLAQATFVCADAHAYRTDSPFDAIVGRHVLIHAPDPLSLLRSLWPHLRSRGLGVFQEYDFSVWHPSYPESPVRDQVFGVFRDFFCKVINGDMGSRLFNLFLEIGFVSPDCRVEYPIAGGVDSPYYEWMAESLKSILPRAEALGLVRAADVDIDTLADRMKEEAVSRKSALPAPLMVGCFARKP